MKLIPMLIALLLMAVPSTVAARSPLPEPVITTNGLAGAYNLKVGVRKSTIQRQIGAGNPNHDDPFHCDIHPVSGLNGVQVMIEDGVVTSVIIQSSKPATPSGARVGMTDRQLRAIYGKRLKRSEHTYQDAPAAYYTLRSSSGNKVVFDVNEQRRVTEIRAGRSADYVEGCF